MYCRTPLEPSVCRTGFSFPAKPLSQSQDDDSAFSGSMSGGLLCLNRAELDDLRRFARCPPHLHFLPEGIGHVKGNKATHNRVV